MKDLPKEVRDFLKGLELPISDQKTGYSIELKGYTNALDFFKNERDFWNVNLSGFNVTLGRWIPEIEGIIARIEATPSEATISLDQAKQKWSHIQGQLQHLIQYQVNRVWPYFFSNTSEAALLRDLAENGQDQIIGAIRYIMNESIQNIQHPQMVGYLTAFLHTLEETGKYPKLKAETARLKRLGTQWENKVQDLNEAFDRLTSTQSDWQEGFQEENQTWNDHRQQQFDDEITNFTKKHTTFYGEAQQSIQTLEKTYDELLKLKAPTKFWKIRAGQYQRKAKHWMIGLICAIAAVITLFTCFLYQPPDLLFPESSLVVSEIPEAGEVQQSRPSYFTPSTIKGFLILATIISIAVYLIRVAAKMTFSSFHLERDAEERRQLTLVYLALMKGGDATQEDREIILQSLFSRADIGILGGDSAPTMPTSFIDRFIGGGK